MEKKTTKPKPARADNAAAGVTDLPSVLLGPQGDYDVRDLANVLFQSGYCGDLTPAQIMVHIIAGRSLGLDDMQGVFDLEFGPDRSVKYRRGRPYQKAGDDIDETKAANRAALDRSDPKPPPSTTPDPASKARDNVVPLQKIDAADPTSQKSDTKRDKGPSPIENGPDDAKGVPVPADVTGPDDGETGGQLSEPGEGDPAAAIDSMLRELGYSYEARRERIDKFRAFEDPAEKTKMLADCQDLYRSKVETVRFDVLAKLVEDGKRDTEQQKGFFIFAQVGTEPLEWTYPEAIQARDALVRFLSRK